MGNLKNYFSRIMANNKIRPMVFKLESLKPIKYRVRCVYETLTKQEIKKFRIREIEAEFLNSKKLKSCFLKTKELKLLKHDRFLKTAEIDRSLSILPKYLIDQFSFEMDKNTKSQL